MAIMSSNFPISVQAKFPRSWMSLLLDYICQELYVGHKALCYAWDDANRRNAIAMQDFEYNYSHKVQIILTGEE